MPYIIDGNNLAGKFDILFEDSFCERLIRILKKFNKRRKRNIILVFDSLEPMGDKEKIDKYLTVIYAPRDNFYKSADDKIVELVERNIKNKENVILVTDDLEIINIIKASDFVKKIRENISVNFALDKVGQNAIQGRWGEDLNKEDIKKINDELLRLWGEN